MVLNNFGQKLAPPVVSSVSAPEHTLFPTLIYLEYNMVTKISAIDPDPRPPSANIFLFLLLPDVLFCPVPVKKTTYV